MSLPENQIDAPRPDLTDELNPRQWEVVRHGKGPLMVVAGAGSGKTRAITHRIFHLIQDHQVRPESILAITFTNKAAREMRSRVLRRLEPGNALPWVSTFHSFCLAMLRRHIGELGRPPDFVIFDGQDQLALLKKCMQAANVNHEAFPPRTLLARISGFKNDFLLPENLDLESFSYGAGLKAAEIYPRYQEALRANNALDFDDLLFLAVQLLREVGSVREFFHGRYRYVVVDEFQDTNVTQYRLVQLLSGPERNVCVVGDDDQSIYRWRGANLENMLNFEKDFPGTRIIKLEQNYRSTRNILQAAGAVVRENLNRKDKTLWTENEAGDRISYYRAEDEADEGRAVCDRLLKWHRDAGLSLSETAVLYRTNAQSRAVEDELRHRQVPYRVVGGLKFYDRKEVKDVLAYMRAILNPADSVSLKRIINLPARGIGKTTVNKVEAWCADRGASLLEGFRRARAEGLVGSGPGTRIASFLQLFENLERLLREASPLDFLQGILEQTGYLAMLEKDKSSEGKGRTENLDELYNAVEEFVQDAERGSLPDFLDSISLASDQDQLDDGRGVALLMTLHTCKGLEFDGVIIIGVENGLLPHASSLSSPEEYEEERRLCYVGFTRARKKLMVINARRRRIHGNTFSYPPSDFLMSIPGELLDKESSLPPLDSRDRGAPRQAYAKTPVVPSSGGGSPSASREDYAIGTRVIHPKFGQGVVVQREGMQDDPRVVVFFKSAGKKKLAVKQARLIVI